MDMYEEVILEHYKNPQNHGKIDQPSADREEYNPLCGDKVRIQLIIKDDKIEDIRFQGRGCAISTASTSLLTQHVKGKTLAEVKKLDKDDIVKLLGVDVNPTRFKCVLLGLKTLKLAIYQYLIDHKKHVEEKEFKVSDA